MHLTGQSEGKIAHIAQLWYPLLAAIFLLALWLRWPYPEPAWTHVDERVFLLNPLKLWSGDFNPHYFVYPTLHIYLCSALYYLYYLLCYSEPVTSFLAYNFFVDGRDLIEVARGFNSLLSAATVLVVAATGRRMYGAIGGLMAGFFFCILPLSARFAHLAATDTPAVLWISFALLGSVRIIQQGRTRDYLLAGISAGLAGATKYPAAMICLPLALACLLRSPTLRQQGLWLAAGLSAATFALTSPYVVLDVGSAWADLSRMGQEHLVDEAKAAADASSAEFYLRYGLRHGVGLIGMLATIVALAWPNRRKEDWVMLAAVGSFVVLLVMAESAFIRYALPLAPLCALLWVRLIDTRRGWLAAVAVLALSAEPLYASWQTRQLLSGDDTREQATEWLDQHAAKGAVVFNLPGMIGNIEVLNPQSVFIRKNRFLLSFSNDDLLDAFASLARREDLPPLYRFLHSKKLPDLHSDDAPSEAFVLWYQHPACGQVVAAAELALLERCTWAAEFSPGDMATATYEPVDWYFAPIDDFAAVERTGPLIRLGRVVEEGLGGVIDARDFFIILHNILKGNALTVEEEWQQALAVYDTVAQVPLDLSTMLSTSYLYDYLYSYGLSYSKMDMVPQAIERWQQAVELRADDAVLHYNLGVGYARLGRADQAANHLVAAVKLDSQYVEAYFNLGNVLYLEDKLDGALVAWQQAIAIDPDFAMAHLNLGNVHYDRQEWDQALRAYKRTSELMPGNGRIYYNIAQTHLQKAEPDAAIVALHRVVELDPNDAEAHFRLGALYAQGGKKQKARPFLMRALALNPQHDRVAQIQALLQ